jgi:RNA polymerase sigma factor (sigma-70 family)
MRNLFIFEQVLSGSMDVNKDLTEQALVQKLLNRDKNAMSVLYDRYSSALYGVIHRILETDELAEDVLQEAFLKIWKNIDSYDADKGRLFTWMLNIARNLSIDKLRSKEFKNSRQNQDIDNNVYAVDSQSRVEYNPDLIGLKQLVEKLKTDQRQIVELVYFSGYTQAEVAEKTGIPLGTVKTRLRAAINELRKVFVLN